MSFAFVPLAMVYLTGLGVYPESFAALLIFLPVPKVDIAVAETDLAIALPLPHFEASLVRAAIKFHYALSVRFWLLLLSYLLGLHILQFSLIKSNGFAVLLNLKPADPRRCRWLRVHRLLLPLPHHFVIKGYAGFLQHSGKREDVA